jgi:nitrite reductase/ring-hydroxylating ferredoxin subunit
LKFSSVDQIISTFKREEFSFSNFSLISEGKFNPLDSLWNYMDVPHANFVHEQVDSDYTVVGDDHASVVTFQKLAGLKIPLSITNYSRDPTSMTYYMTWLFFILIIESNAEEVEPGLTKVTTSYHLGSTALFKIFHPIIHWILKRNYKTLMAVDIPMRERRGQLRRWGYSFSNESPKHSFERSLDVFKLNVIFPEKIDNRCSPVELVVQNILPSDGEYLHGRDDHFGVQIVRSGDTIMVYPRLCPHDGASLDRENYWACSRNREVSKPGEKKYKIMCPWHGRLFDPIASFELSSQETQEAGSDYLLLNMNKNVLTISQKN